MRMIFILLLSGAVRARATLAVLCGLVCSLAGQTSVWATHPEDSFIVSGSPERPPFYWRQGEECLGAGRELVERALASVGMKATFQCDSPWERSLFDAKQGKVDALVGCIPSMERSRYLAFVEPLLTRTEIAVWVWKERSFPYYGWSDLIGKRGVAVRGDGSGEAFGAYAKSKLNLDYVSTPLEGLKKLEFGRAQFFLFSKYGGRLHLEKKGLDERIVSLEPAVAIENVYLAISKRSRLAEYLPHLETALYKLRAEGEFERLLKKYETLYLEGP